MVMVHGLMVAGPSILPRFIKIMGRGMAEPPVEDVLGATGESP